MRKKKALKSEDLISFVSESAPFRYFQKLKPWLEFRLKVSGKRCTDTTTA
jgi:hypothetical protein